MWGRALGRSGSGSRGAGGCLDSHSSGTHTRLVVTFGLLAIGVIISITAANYTPSLLPFPFLCPCSIPSSTLLPSTTTHASPSSSHFLHSTITTSHSAGSLLHSPSSLASSSFPFSYHHHQQQLRRSGPPATHLLHSVLLPNMAFAATSFKRSRKGKERALDPDVHVHVDDHLAHRSLASRGLAPVDGGFRFGHTHDS